MKKKPAYDITKPVLITLLIMLLGLMLVPVSANAELENPLKPIDTSSPRTTLLGFIEFMNKSYDSGVGLVNAYLASSDSYLSSDFTDVLRMSFHYQDSAHRALDLSEIAPIMVGESSRRLAIQLKEILDRIDIPNAQAIPDAEAMTKAEFKRWTLPNSEIRIQRVESGPRAGEYLFSPETVLRIPEFYEKTRHLPYKTDASIGWNDFSSYTPVGLAIALHRIIPTRWLIDSPQHRNRTTFLDQPLWRWVGIVLVLGIGFYVVNWFFRLRLRWITHNTSVKQWLDLLRPLSLVIVAPLVAFILTEILRVSDSVYQVIMLSMWSLFYLALTWTTWTAGGAIASSLSKMEKLQIGSIDSQLIRLVMRLITVVAAILIIVAGADRVGLPAYSIVAGLGVGGLAVALAAQQTLANLLGSLIIMFEKPFAVGDNIKLKDIEGTVESVGFRSTRIRTTHNSLVTIPSSQLVNSTVDNMEMRQYRQVKVLLCLDYGTPIDKIQDFVNSVKQLLETHSKTRKDNIQVALNDLSASSLDILVNFFLKVSNRAEEIAEKQQLLVDILSLSETAGIQFSLPTQNIHIECTTDKFLGEEKVKPNA